MVFGATGIDGNNIGSVSCSNRIGVEMRIQVRAEIEPVMEAEMGTMGWNKNVFSWNDYTPWIGAGMGIQIGACIGAICRARIRTRNERKIEPIG